MVIYTAGSSEKGIKNVYHFLKLKGTPLKALKQKVTQLVGTMGG
jgi:hypothetical protein